MTLRRPSTRALLGALLVFQAGASGISGSADRIRDSATRPLPSSAPRPVERPTAVWVPDRYMPYPGEPGGVFVPGHWELRVNDREVMTPPTTVERREDGSFTTIPGSTRQAP